MSSDLTPGQALVSRFRSEPIIDWSALADAIDEMVAWRTDPPKPEDSPVNVRSTTTYRWMQYSGKSEQFRRGVLGRWQRATEYGYENAPLPAGAEWVPNRPLPLPPSGDPK